MIKHWKYVLGTGTSIIVEDYLVPNDCTPHNADYNSLVCTT